MKFIADLHLHSKYSRATSNSSDLENFDVWARKKGIKVLGTSDFTHPIWMKELKEKLELAEPGLYKLKKNDNGTRFLLSTEISSIYSQGGKTRRVHNIVFAPNIEIAEQINVVLGWQGNLRSDGRPILGISSIELAKLVFNISSEAVIIPAHAWTPWFSVFGSMSGFDSLEECFEEFTDKIFAIETGLSSDPEMNWQLSKLDNISLISNSDAHSPQKIGREANVFEIDLSYQGIISAIKERNPQKFLYTIEFFPEEGKYHCDGHRNCNIVFNPEQTEENNNICPCCKKPLTVGVLNRVKKLSDRDISSQVSRDNNSFIKLNNRVPFKKVIPLYEIIGEILGVGPNSKAVEKEYEKLISIFKNEFNILLNEDIEEIKNQGFSELAKAIDKMRKEDISISPGYDGEFGKISIFRDGESKKEENLLF